MKSCPECGVSGYEPGGRCPACHHHNPGVLVLESVDTGHSRSARIATLFGRRLLRTFCGDSADRAATEQFRVAIDAASGGWTLVHLPGACETRVNANAADTPVRLASGDEISIGKDGPRLRVRLDFGA